jgi:thymidylate kinase
LKPKKKKTESNQVETNPHKKNNYSSVLSILKLVYFLFEYNFNWIKNIIPKKITPVLIVFDRYFDDIIADPKRYRYGAPEFVVRVFRKFIPSPDTTFVLDAPAEVVLSRKKEVSQISLEAQLEKYRALGNRKNYFIIKVNRPINEIVQDVIKIIIKQ